MSAIQNFYFRTTWRWIKAENALGLFEKAFHNLRSVRSSYDIS
jgi:hypothetical protein